MLKKTLILSILFVLLGGSVLFGQHDNYLTRVKLKDGSVLEGRMTEFVEDEYIKMNIGESEITIKHSSIKSIKHQKARSLKEYKFREEGWYHHTSAGFLPGFISAGSPVLGVEIDHSSGFLFNRFLGAGINIAATAYNPFHNESTYSLAGELRGYLLENYLSPYYAIRGGYAFVFGGDNFLEANGGYFVNPAIGLRLTGKNGPNLTAEIGLNFQDAHYKYETQWWDRSIIEKDVLYRRLTLKLGLLF